jgi:dolichol-phosphate mannosyltransferase
MRALVTGAGGFIGANLVRRLLDAGQTPIAAVRPGEVPWRLSEIASEVELLPVDLSDPAATEASVLRSHPEAIFHLAASGAYSWQQDLDAMLAVNVRALDALLSGARRTDATLVNAGSSSEYGLIDHPAVEGDRLEPNSHYAVTKSAATHLCRLAAGVHGQTAITVRLYSIYGPWEDPGRLMPVLVRSARAGVWPPLVAPDTARDFVWVDDACDALLAAADPPAGEPGAVFNVASGVETTIGALVEIVRALFEVAAEPVWGEHPARRWDTTRWVGDPTHAESHLGWRASTPLADGLARLAAWFDAHPELDGRYAPASSA